MASLETIFRQVAREGAPWGLFPVRRGNKIGVAEMVAELSPYREGCPRIVEKTPRIICSLDESSPMDAFASILRHRLSRKHHDFMRMVAVRQQRLAAEQQREVEQRKRDVRAHYEAKFLRSRTVFGPGITPLEPGLRR